MYAATCLHGTDRRIFMAKTVQALGDGGQRGAETLLGWNRGTIRKGMHELQSGICCIDNFSGRGRRPIEYNLPELSKDIEEVVKPTSQTDPTFRTTKIYTPLTAKMMRNRLIEEKGYTNQELPVARTIGYKMNQLNLMVS